MSTHDVFTLDLPDDDPESRGELVPFPGADQPAVEGDASERTRTRIAFVDRVRPFVEHFTSGWRAVWVGDGVLGMRPRPVADLARQFWFAPKPYIRDAWILRVPYAIYGAPVIALSAAAHLLLFVVSYPSVLAASGVLVLFLSLFL